MKKNILISVFCLFSLLSTNSIFAQRTCASHDHLQLMLQQHPELREKIEEIERHTEAFVNNPRAHGRTVITIPVVFHIVWRSGYPVENISDAQVMSQLTVMNADFAKLNTDTSNVPALFAPMAADCEIRFCLAQRSPAATPTNGIVHYQSSRTTAWGTNDGVKSAFAPWDPTRYLNIWVCNIGSGILGYAQFPGGSMATDGVVIDYRYLGTNGTATAPFHLGRTVTHEVGHWLNLRHIWGDSTCGSDLVGDTPIHTTSNSGCPLFPKINSCSGQSNTEMTMNFMDYSDDECMYMFSSGQKARMRALFSSGGVRESLLSSDGCQPVYATSCPVPSGLNVTGISSGSAKISWNSTSTVSSFSVRYKRNASSSWTLVGCSTNSLVLTALSSSTNYAVQVASVCSGAAGAYSPSLTFSTLAAGSCTDVYEPNNSMTTAVSIATGLPIRAMISSGTDDDWLKVSTTAAQKKIKVTLYDLPEDYDLFLYSSAGSMLASSKNLLNAVETVTYNNGQSAANYYIRVVSTLKKYSHTACYSLYAEIGPGNFRASERDLRKTENLTEQDMVLYPNPVNDRLEIQLKDKVPPGAKLLVCDGLGRLMREIDTDFSGGFSTAIDTRDFPEGLYVLMFCTGSSRTARKFIIRR